MKTIGLLGGMSWESTVTYYRSLNEIVKQRLGGLHSAKIVLHSVDFYEIEQLQRRGDWLQAGDLLADAAQALERAGADCVVLCTNTMHKVADQIQTAVKIPLLHIADATAKRICDVGLNKVGLLATRFTMEQDFYISRLADRYGIEVRVPNAKDRDIVHRIIYEELCLGQIREDSRAQYRRIMADMVEREGVQAIILGCTEISLLVDQSDASVPLFDTTAIHAQAVADFALSKD